MRANGIKRMEVAFLIAVDCQFLSINFCHFAGARLVFLRGEGAADDWIHVEDAKKFWRDKAAANLLRRLFARERELAAADG